MNAINAERLNGVSFEHCGVCGWHYRFYATMQGGDKVYLGDDVEAVSNPEWGEYGTPEAYENGRRYLDARAKELVRELAAHGERRAV